VDPPVADLPSLPLEAAAPADLAGDAHVWQEAHLQSLHPLALTGGAAPARGVEGETGGSLVPGARAAGNQRRAAYPAARHRGAPVSGQRRQLPRAPRRGELHSPLRFLPQPPRPLPLRRHRRGVRAGRGCRRCSRSCPLFGGLVAGPVLPAADRFNPCRGGAGLASILGRMSASYWSAWPLAAHIADRKARLPGPGGTRLGSRSWPGKDLTPSAEC